MTARDRRLLWAEVRLAVIDIETVHDPGGLAGSARDEVDQAWPGSGVLYFARLSARRTQSKMSSIVGTPEYQQMTIRSWATTTKLLALLDG